MSTRQFRLYSTSSELGRLGKCPASAALSPRVGGESDASNEGNAGHEHFEDRIALGIDAAMARIPDVARRWFGNDEREAAFFAARMRKLEWSPPAGSFGEVALCMFEDGRVERTSGGKGHYPELEPGGRHEGAILAGQLDAMWSEPEPLDLTDPEHPRCPPGSYLVVPDWKFGEAAYVEPVESNLQAANNAVMAAKWTGARRVLPAIVFMEPPQCVWDVPMRDDAAFAWGPRELADAEARVRDVRRRVLLAIEAEKAGLLTGFNEGSWCAFCPGKHSCPAKIAMMRSTAAIAPTKRGPVTVDELRWWAERLPQIESHVRLVRELMKEHVDQTGQPIDLGHGLAWGPKPSKRDKLIPHVALPIITAELGADKLDELVSVSKSAVEAVVKKDHEAKGIKRQRSKVMGRLLGEIKKANGIRREVGVEYGVYRPTHQLPGGDNEDLEGEVVDGDEEGAAAE